MVRTNEGGSVLSFAVVGVILAILLVGGVAAVRQHFVAGQQTAPATQKVTKTDKKDTSSAPAASNANQTPANEGQASSGGSTSAPAPAATQPSTSSASTDTASGVSNTAPSSELPHTGPVSTVTTVLALGFLTGSFIAYLRSRRRLGLPSTSI